MAYLWIHVAGLALVPLLLQVVWIGLAISQPLPFFWLELVFLIIFGLFPIIFLQWNRPFSPFNLLFFTLKIDTLTEDERRLLTALKSNLQRFLTAIASIVSIVSLWFIYQYAPLAREAASFLPQVRLFGLLIAIIAYFFVNLFWQVSLSVIPVMFTKIDTLEPYPTDKIKQDFTVFGFPVAKLLSSFQ
jgi:hypothetical protein